MSLLISAAITGVTGVPGPETHDEFSYLLAADTFAHGRLTNLAHPLWQHFESFHIIQQPTYMSKYPPGQGLVLAAGQALAGEPVVGAWLAATLACAAVSWALRAWVPKRWAMLAGCVMATHPLLLLWGQNYWGGSLAAAGGAFVFGAAGRLRWAARPFHAAMLGLGVALLTATRPFEGLVFTALVVAPLLLPRVRQDLRKGRAAAAVCAGVLIVAAGWMGYYNARVTGSPLRLPYMVHEAQYALAPTFLWQREWPPKSYRHDSVREYHEEVELPHYRGQRSLAGFASGAAEKAWILARAYGGHPLVPFVVIGIVWAVRRRRAVRLMTGVLIAFVAVLMLTNWMFAHYAAPATVVVAFLAIMGLRALFRTSGTRVAVVVGTMLISLGTAGYWAIDRAETIDESWGRIRQGLIGELLASPGDDLVVVRYGRGRNINTEWVYNGADIDGAPIVWARDMGDTANDELFRHFRGRTVWLLAVGADGARIAPYPGRQDPTAGETNRGPVGVACVPPAASGTVR